MFDTRSMRSLLLAAGTALVLAGAAFAGTASQTRPSSSHSSSGGSHSVSGHSSSGSSSSGSYHSSSSSSGPTRVQGNATYHHGGGYYPRGGGYYPYYRGYYPYYPSYWGWGWNWWWWGDWGYYYPPAYTHYDGYSRAYPNDDYGEMGALDLDVSPEKAQVYVNGQRLGICDDFDGWPDYLWLRKGTYDVVFYLPGFKTIAQQVTVVPGLVIDFNDQMEPGPAVRPEDLPAKTHERADERLRQDQEAAREAARRPPADWRERAPQPLEESGQAPEPPRSVVQDARRAPARLHLDIVPDDASVYLDGRFVGTGGDLEAMRSGLIIDAGDHKLEVVRPQRKTATQSFTAKPGEDVSLSVSLANE